MSRDTQIYFAQAASGGPVKIGLARNPSVRLRALEQAEPLVLLGSGPGLWWEEAELHERLAAHRIRGEWFEDCAAVREAMASFHDTEKDAT